MSTWQTVVGADVDVHGVVGTTGNLKRQYTTVRLQLPQVTTSSDAKESTGAAEEAAAQQRTQIDEEAEKADEKQDDRPPTPFR